MSSATLPRLAPERSGPEEELRHIRDLVFVRDLLRERGATAAELREYDAVIDEARGHLAESAKHASSRYARAA